MKTLYKSNTQIPVKYIIEIGLCRSRNTCALCGKKMDVPNYHIQLCRKCRLKKLDEIDKIWGV